MSTEPLIDNDDVASELFEIEEAIRRAAAPIPENERRALLARLLLLPSRTDSGIGLCLIARAWISLDGEEDAAREMLRSAEEFGGPCVDYSGTFDDFEEEDSYLAYLAMAVDSCLKDLDWVDSLLISSLSDDRYADRVGDSIWFAANRFGIDKCRQLVISGTERRLDEQGFAPDLKSVEAVFSPTLRILGVKRHQVLTPWRHQELTPLQVFTSWPSSA